MNEDDLNEIEARCNAATPGEWKAKFQHHKTIVRSLDPGGMLDVCIVQPWMTHEEPNAIFIAHSRTDIPKLIAEVRRLREELAKASGLQSRPRKVDYVICGAVVQSMRFEGSASIQKTCIRREGHQGNHYDGLSEWTK